MSIRKSAREEAERTGLFLGDWQLEMNLGFKMGFEDGATWAEARITPTREQIAQALADTYEPEYNIVDESDYHGADAVLDLMNKLARGEQK